MTTRADTRAKASNAVNKSLEVYITFLQELFRRHSSGEMMWSSDQAASEIVIQERAPVEAAEVGQRPIIMVGRGAVQTGVFINRAGGHDFETGADVESDILSTAMQVFCISTEGIEAESIAFYVHEQILSMRKELQHLGGFQKVLPSVTLSEEMPAGALVKGDDSWKMVVVTSPVVLQYFTYTTLKPDHPHYRTQREVIIEVQNRLGVPDRPESAALEALHRVQLKIRRFNHDD